MDWIATDYSILIINLGIIMFLGLTFGRLAEYIKLPAIVGYLIAGLILGPISGVLNQNDTESLRLISDLALGFIAFEVGNELWFGKLKKSGKKIIIITLLQALLTSIIVFLSLLFFTDVSVALILGAIAAATAPAPIIMIINKYNAKGDLKDTIIPIVGLDDAVGVIIFGVFLSISVSIVGTTANTNMLELLLEPFIEIGISILLGVIIGLIAGLAIKHITKDFEARAKNLEVIIITVLITVGLALSLNASPILTPMIAGAMVTNMINKETYMLEEDTIKFFIPPLMIMFFTVSGARLDFSVLPTVGIIGIIYIIGRTIGKFLGSYFCASITNSASSTKKYLGFAMLPQSGVAIGLSMAAYNALIDINQNYAETINNVTLASVLFFALTGPILVKIAFQKAGEIK